MSLKIIKFEPRLARIVLIAAATLCVATAWFFIKWHFANAAASRIDSERPEAKLVADWLTQVAPDDPQTHITAAIVFEKTFEPDDLARSLSEFELATALSPNDYMMWLNLGKSRSLNGDSDGAEAAYRRTLELAPNYAHVQWVYGNTLIREGKTDEGFAMIAKAAGANPDYSRTAAATALQIFDGDPAKVRAALGDTDVTNAALSTSLAAQTRYDEAFEAWSKLSVDDKIAKFKELGDGLIVKLVVAKRYQLASRVASDLQTNNAEKPVIGQISNGGFENGVRLKNPGVFEWQIADGAEPQIGLSDTQKRTGKYSLWVSFNSFQTAAFRSVSQVVAVESGAQYEFEVCYRSDVKTSATLKWEIADMTSAATLASTPPLVPAGDWTSIKTIFIVPKGSEGVIIRFVREGCNGPSCPTNGKLSFDDLSLRRL